MLILFLHCGTGFETFASEQPLSDSDLANIKFEQKLGSRISLDSAFRDETGAEVKLSQYFSRKPVILVLGYYKCPMLCSLVQNGMVESLQDLRWNIGKEYEVINVSINPSEKPELAAAKKRTCLKRYGRVGASEGWHFLTGDEANIRRLADQVGFRYAYDSATKEYAHPSGFIVLTPEGKIARYFFGIQFSPRELYPALLGASSQTIGTRIQELVLLCFHYRPITSKYGALIMTTVRVMAVATVAGLGWLIIGMVLREKPGKTVSADALRTDREPPSARSGNDGSDAARPPIGQPCSKQTCCEPGTARGPEHQGAVES
jgi:protein SCO1/2